MVAVHMLHQKQIDNFRFQYNDVFYTIFRIMVGILFMFHGAQKLFGVFAKSGPKPLMSLMGVAGIVEFFGGLLIVLGLFTSLVAIIAAVQMVVAFFKAHFTIANPVPILNGGELALLYLAVFLYIFFEGGGKYSVDAKMCKNCEKEHK